MQSLLTRARSVFKIHTQFMVPLELRPRGIPPKGFLGNFKPWVGKQHTAWHRGIPPESGNSILDQNTIKREVAFMGAIPCGRNSTVTITNMHIHISTMHVLYVHTLHNIYILISTYVHLYTLYIMYSIKVSLMF